MHQLTPNPERYRTGPNYKGTNIVFTVEFNNQTFIAKQPRLIIGSLFNAYYTFQDAFFYGTRQLSTARRLWFPTRLPLNGRLNEQIKRVLRE